MKIVLQELNNVKFIEFITRNRPYDFKTDIGHIKTTLGSESKLLQTDTEEDVLNFMLNNLGYEFQIPNSKIKFICSDYFEKWLNQIKDQNKNVPNYINEFKQGIDDIKNKYNNSSNN